MPSKINITYEKPNAWSMAPGNSNTFGQPAFAAKPNFREQSGQRPHVTNGIHIAKKANPGSKEHVLARWVLVKTGVCNHHPPSFGLDHKKNGSLPNESFSVQTDGPRVKTNPKRLSGGTESSARNGEIKLRNPVRGPIIQWRSS